jgi:hypothetical protein
MPNDRISNDPNSDFEFSQWRLLKSYPPGLDQSRPLSPDFYVTSIVAGLSRQMIVFCKYLPGKHLDIREGGQ